MVYKIELKRRKKKRNKVKTISKHPKVKVSQKMNKNTMISQIRSKHKLIRFRYKKKFNRKARAT